jgi:ATP-dependent Clp protease adapter protein ClpS
MQHLLSRLRAKFLGPPDDSVVIAKYVDAVCGYACREGSIPLTVASLTRYVLFDLPTDAIRALLAAYEIKLVVTSFDLEIAEQSNETSKVSPEVVEIVSRAQFMAKSSGKAARIIDPANVLVSLAMHPVSAAILERLGLTRLKIAYFLSHGRALPVTPGDEVSDLTDAPSEVLVCIKNDDYTATERVTQVLGEIFELPAEQASETMRMIHSHKQMFLGPYTYEDARNKVAQAIAFMRQAAEPLLISLARDNTIAWADAWRDEKHRRLRRISAKQGRPLGFIRGHWRGERSFAASFWIVGVLGTAVLACGYAVLLAKAMLHLQPDAAIKISLAALLLIAAIFSWQWSGIWRAARRYKTSPWRTCLATSAQLAMAAVALGSIGMGARAFPHVRDFNQLYSQSELVPNYSVALEGRDTVVFTGGLRFGAAGALNRVLETHPDVRIVRLDSPGGLAAEGALMRGVLAEHGLIAHVRGTCASACAAAFLGGSRRYVSEGGRLVFHRSRHGLRDDAPESSYSARFLMGRSGIEQSFIDRVASTPATSGWTPTHAELLAAGVVHEIGEPD